MGKTEYIIILIIFNLIFIAFIAAIIMFISQYKKKKKTHHQELASKSILHKKELLETQTEIQKETMQYIGREIHDNVGQKLTLSSLYLQQIIIENKAPELHKNINNINDLIDESLTELRLLSKSLTDDFILQNTFTELIDNELKKIHTLKKYSIDFTNTLDKKVNSYQEKSILLRIIQEFLQNSIKHAKCKTISIHLSNIADEIQLILKDDGIGFNVENISNHNGIGIKNIKNRVKILNGNYSLTSNKNGTILIIKIPA